MKHLFLKSAVLLCTLSVAYSCSDDPSSAKGATPDSCPIQEPCYYDASSNYVLYGDAYLLKAGENSPSDYIIYPSLNLATDAKGNRVGKFNGSNAIIGDDGTPIVNGIVLNGLEILTPVIPPEPVQPNNGQKYQMLDAAAWLLHADQDYLIYIDGRVTDVNCNVVANMDDPMSQGNIVSNTTGETLVENVSTANLPIISLTDNIACPAQNITSSASNVNSSNSNGTKPASSTTTKQSSSATTPKSSSQNATASCPTIKTKGGGGSGWATRYWDCCKPSCSWNENAGGHLSKQCDAKGKNQNNDYGAQSVCSGGNAATCLSQIPFTIDGCKEYAFAFAAVPASNGGQCGKCFQLTFTGKGKYGDCPNCKKLAAAKKKLIIMVTNVGHDVEQGQFDIMIPGGGVGAFNGCNQMGWGAQGEQYGGLLSDCEKETNYSAGGYASCLEKKCNSVFGNDEQAKEGCLFLANWMNAASNPEHNYVEVECPSVLSSKY